MMVSGANDPTKGARALHERAIVVDTHSDLTSRMLEDGFDPGPRSATGHMDLVRMKEGGLDAQFFAIYVAEEFARGGAARRALDMIDAVRGLAARHPDELELATSVADVQRIAGSGRIAALMGIEGGHAIENSLAALRMFHTLGVRYMTLTHTNTNDWCDSSGDKPRWNGLNDFGRQVVREMNRLGVIVDVSHVSDEAFFDVIETSTAPVFASHSSCRSLCNHPRNMTDEMIKALAARGGVIQINFAAAFLDEDYRRVVQPLVDKARADARAKQEQDPDAMRKEMKRIFASSPAPLPPLSRLVDHIDHVVKLVGPDHVGLGSDFDGVPTLPAGLEDCSRLPAITAELLRRGYGDEDVVKILGANTLRLMEAVEKESRRLSAQTS
jgi:membrane dipeptidase